MGDKWDSNRVIVIVFTVISFAAISPFILFGISLFEVSSRITLIAVSIGIFYMLRDMVAQLKRLTPLKDKATLEATSRE